MIFKPNAIVVQVAILGPSTVEFTRRQRHVRFGNHARNNLRVKVGTAVERCHPIVVRCERRLIAAVLVFGTGEDEFVDASIDEQKGDQLLDERQVRFDGDVALTLDQQKLAVVLELVQQVRFHFTQIVDHIVVHQLEALLVIQVDEIFESVAKTPGHRTADGFQLGGQRLQFKAENVFFQRTRCQAGQSIEQRATKLLASIIVLAAIGKVGDGSIEQALNVQLQLLGRVFQLLEGVKASQFVRVVLDRVDDSEQIVDVIGEKGGRKLAQTNEAKLVGKTNETCVEGDEIVGLQVRMQEHQPLLAIVKQVFVSHADEMQNVVVVLVLNVFGIFVLTNGLIHLDWGFINWEVSQPRLQRTCVQLT